MSGRPGLAGVVLAAGAGTRLRPLTELRPKAMCPVGGVPLLDHALARLAPLVPAGALAVNAAHRAEDVVRGVRGRAHVSVEVRSPDDQALGTAGALGRLREWLDGRDALVTNADAYVADGPAALAGLLESDGGWDGERCRLLCQPVRRAPDFRRGGRGFRYVGACLLPWHLVSRLAAEPTGLYEVLWRAEEDAGRLELVSLPPDAVVVDCGTPSDYLRANLHASAGASVVGLGAAVEGVVERSVVWDGARVGPDEHLVEVVRAGTPDSPLTVPAPLSP